MIRRGYARVEICLELKVSSYFICGAGIALYYRTFLPYLLADGVNPERVKLHLFGTPTSYKYLLGSKPTPPRAPQFGVARYVSQPNPLKLVVLVPDSSLPILVLGKRTLPSSSKKLVSLTLVTLSSVLPSTPPSPVLSYFSCLSSRPTFTA
jgi:hypothetical protein